MWLYRLVTQEYTFFSWWKSGSFHFLASSKCLRAFNWLMDDILELVSPFSCRFIMVVMHVVMIDDSIFRKYQFCLIPGYFSSIMLSA